MLFQFTPFVFLYLAAACVTGSVGWYAFGQARERGRTKTITSLVVLMAAATLWCLSRVIQYTVVNEAVTWIFLFLVMVAWAIAAVALFAFGLAYTGRGDLLTTRTVTACSVPIVIALSLFVTNDLHLVFGRIVYTEQHGMLLYVNRPSTWYALYAAYLNGLVFYGVYRLLRSTLTSATLYRKQSLAVIVGAATPAILGTLFLADATPLVPPFIDLTPVGFGVTGVCFGYAVFEYGLLELVPIARRTAWNELGDAVIMVDAQDRIVDANSPARRLFDIDGGYLGEPATAYLAPEISERLTATRSTGDAETAVSLQVEGKTRHFLLSISALADEAASHSGRVIVLREVTTLKRREEELDLLRQVQSRVLRHNIRNELTKIRGNIQLLAEQTGDEQFLGDAVEASDDLLSISRKARLVEEVVDGELTATEYDLRGVVEKTTAEVSDRYPDVEFMIEGPETCSVEAAARLEIAIENLLENAAEHNDAAAPRVTVRIDDGQRIRLTIADNGPGIPDEEIAVLEDERETDLEHGSGIGLWLVKWIVDRSGAAVAFDATDQGTTVTLRFPDGKTTSGEPEPQAVIA